MQKNYPVGHRCTAYVLLVSLFTQSCTNLTNPLTSHQEAQEQQNQRDNSQE
jgi:hypothetical protein